MFDPGLAFVNSQVHYDLDSLSSRNSIITTRISEFLAWKPSPVLDSHVTRTPHVQWAWSILRNKLDLFYPNPLCTRSVKYISKKQFENFGIPYYFVSVECSTTKDWHMFMYAWPFLQCCKYWWCWATFRKLEIIFCRIKLKLSRTSWTCKSGEPEVLEGVASRAGSGLWCLQFQNRYHRPDLDAYEKCVRGLLKKLGFIAILFHLSDLDGWSVLKKKLIH